MQKQRKQRSKLTMLIMSLGLVSGSNLYADGFYTIIGPDGRPMIVPNKEQVKVQNQSVNDQALKSAPVKQISPKKDEPVVKERVIVTTTQPVYDKVPLEQKDVSQLKNSRIEEKHQEVVIDIPSDQSEKNSNRMNSQNKNNEVFVEPQKNFQSNDIKVSLNTSKISTKLQDEQEPFTDIDGVKYVNNEFLEDQEFNLEGKKRFYTMPDGSGRLETIERKKGVNRSMLDRIMNRSLESNKPITLAESYVRLSEQDLALAFENDRCFLEGYSKSIKKLTPKKEIGIWPRKPLKEKFEYELIELDSSIRYVQMDSFASSIESPAYYWPLVVFLDEKGCINEGVSGFKNATVNTSLFKHAAIQGTLRIPSNTRYLMMTPLASAVDVPEKELSNQGQINLSVLQ